MTQPNEGPEVHFVVRSYDPSKNGIWGLANFANEEIFFLPGDEATERALRNAASAEERAQYAEEHGARFEDVTRYKDI